MVFSITGYESSNERWSPVQSIEKVGTPLYSGVYCSTTPDLIPPV